MKKILSLFTALCIISCNSAAALTKTVSAEYLSEDLTSEWQTVAAQSDNTAFSENCAAAVLMEKETGKILYEYNAHDKRPIASITKIMALLLIVEEIDKGTLKLNTPLKASEHAASMGGSQIWLKEGEEMTVDELLKAAVIASANDAIVTLAEGVAGSEETFVKRMNLRSEELNLKDTNFVNCSGLDAENHLSSAHDVAIMSCELLKHDLIKKYSTVWMDTLRSGKSQLVNTNKLVRFYDGTTGLKTGTTSKAGFCVSASAEKNGMELCAVVLGAENNDGRFGTAKKLLNYGFATWKLETVKIPQSDIKAQKVLCGTEDTVNMSAVGSGKYLLAVGEKENLKIRLEYFENITAPIFKGQKLGEAVISSGNSELGRIDLVATKKIEKFTFFKSLYLLFSAAISL